MSWFDAAGLASIAKSALKEAQRTIDKALDIKDETGTAVPSNTPIDTNSDDFFSTWGITQSGNAKTLKKANSEEKSTKSNPKMTGSLWGSFTESFFEAQPSGTAPERKSTSFDNLDDSVDHGTDHFSQSKLVVQQSDDGESLGKHEEDKREQDAIIGTMLSECVENTVSSSSTDTIKRRDKPATSHTNRLSVISIESGKNSSESVDVISCSTECTTSPESDLLSISRSSSGLKVTSESVEVLGDSLITSPSSIEVLGSISPSSRRQSQVTDEFVSPLPSPMVEEKNSPIIEKTSPDSVEIIPDEQEENSIAEDTMSYTSFSESTVLDQTAANIHIKPSKFNRSETLISENFMDVPLSPENTFSNTYPDAITRAPSRSTMHLPLAQKNTVLIDTQPQSSNSDLPMILSKNNVIEVPQESDLEDVQLDSSMEEGSQSDKTLVAGDGIMESSSDTSTATETSGHSTYLKNMLADAMTEKKIESPNSPFDLIQTNTKPGGLLESISISQLDMPPRETSPISSESRSDLVKIGSDHTSGHTSGDELETTTSSDIEIISSPNGDSSSTQSRQSPIKQSLKIKGESSSVDNLLCKMTLKKAKGHTRELSEASSISDDCHSTEIDRLLKRISEMTEILESRESKLVDINRRYVELQETNKDLQLQLDSVLTKQVSSADLSQVTEEYTQRLSALEKKFQQAIREKDTLRKQLEQSKLDAAMRLSKGELETLLGEKDETIRELRLEGEKLSKQQLQHSNIIKKLRTKEKENESTIKHLKENIEGLSAETDRLKRSLTAKEDVERSQIEAVHQLTAKNKKFETELAKLQSQFDDLTEKHDTVKKSLDAAKKEVMDKQKANSELLATEQMLESMENQKKMTESQNEEIINQLEDLRYKLRQSEQDYLKKEQLMRQENTELLRRLEEAETRNEELSQSVMEVSKPLVRQLEALQANHSMKISAFESLEQELTQKIGELQSKNQSLSSAERAAKEDCISMRAKLADLEGQLGSVNRQHEILSIKLTQLEVDKQIKVEELMSEISLLTESLKTEMLGIEEKDKLISSLEHQLQAERTANETERKVLLKEQIKYVEDEGASQTSRSNSPTVSLGKVSVAESLASSLWTPQEEPFDNAPAPKYTNLYEMQILQSSLKQRDGELQQLQWELNRREQERSLLNKEISSLLTKVEQLEANATENETLKVQCNELQQRCDTLCQLYGEKVEETEELKLDLQDVKEMYKGQIDELLRQQKEQNN